MAKINSPKRPKLEIVFFLFRSLLTVSFSLSLSISPYTPSSNPKCLLCVRHMSQPIRNMQKRSYCRFNTFTFTFFTYTPGSLSGINTRSTAHNMQQQKKTSITSCVLTSTRWPTGTCQLVMAENIVFCILQLNDFLSCDLGPSIPDTGNLYILSVCPYHRKRKQNTCNTHYLL